MEQTLMKSYIMEQPPCSNISDMEVEQNIRTRSDAEETATHNTKDSGYSNSCSNSQSQSSGSSKSRHSTSSRSSGYCGRPINKNDGGNQSKRKEKDHKKKKGKNSASSTQQQTEENQQEDNTTNQPMESSGSTDEGLQISLLSQTLNTLKKMKNRDISDESSGSQENQENHNDIKPEQLTRHNKKDEEKENALKIVVSMSDGIVVFTSGLSNVLGYPKEMWLGRSLIDFVQPKHRSTFATHITTAIANLRPGNQTSNQDVFFCCLRKYKGLKTSGYNVSEQPVPYIACQLNLDFQELSSTGNEKPKEYLVITASPVKSAYKYPVETKVSPKFMTRHSSSCQLNHVDPEVTPYFGYLPQDLLGRSILDFYHPEDLHFLKEVYEAVMKEQGHPFKSKPYRFKCQNGDYALVETELSSFINPWSKKLEFIIGQHTVLRGPRNPDVVTPLVVQETVQIPAELLKETKILQEEIKSILNETILRTSETDKQQVSKRCKDLATFMENLMDEITKTPDLKVDVPIEEQSFSERDSVMLGEISPHHDYYDSKSSTETPPSYNQLNYNENIQRFFESKPKTTLCEEFNENKDGKISPPSVNLNISKTTGNSTSQWISTEINANSGETNSSHTVQSSKYSALTEQLLIRHNEDMEKQMVQKHREMRNKNERDSKAKERLKDVSKSGFNEEIPSQHGVKRSGSHSWDGEPHKAIKASHVAETPPTQNRRPTTPSQTDNPPSLWPPFSVSLTPVQSRQEYPGFASALMPLYYVTNTRPESYQHPAYLQQLQYVPSMLYHPVMFGTPPMMYSPLTVYPSPVYPNGNGEAQIQNQTNFKERTNLQGDQNQNTINQDGNIPQKDLEAELTETSVPCDDSSYHSSFYSFLKTDKSEGSLKSSSENEKPEEVIWPNGKTRPIRKVAPWVEGINVTPELILKYQLAERTLEDVLKQDLINLDQINQPSLVNEQLSQMYIDLELEGLSRQLTLDETSQSSSDEPITTSCSAEQMKISRKYMEYDKMTILFEEDAPMPPPLSA